MIEARKLGQLLLSAVLSATLLRSPAADACCMQQPRAAVLLTTRDTKVPDDGGVLVGWRYGGVPRDTDDQYGDTSNQPTWKVKIGKAKPVALTRVSLAPGLSVYKPPAGKGDFTLVDGKGFGLGKFSYDAKAAKNAMVAPTAEALKVWTVPNFRASDRHAQLTLKSAPPAEAVAIIVYQVGKTENVPISFAGLPDTHDKLTTLEVFQDAGRCGSLVPGTRPPTHADNIAFAWVDAFGRVSPLSATIKAKASADPNAPAPVPGPAPAPAPVKKRLP
jgi:hypothetical protein